LWWRRFRRFVAAWVSLGDFGLKAPGFPIVIFNLQCVVDESSRFPILHGLHGGSCALQIVTERVAEQTLLAIQVS
jgi:hypothetical protein